MAASGPGRFVVAAAAALALMGVACGGGDGDTTPTGTTAAPTTTATGTESPGASPTETGSPGDETAEVEAEDIAFSVASITVASGSQVTIQFQNRDDGTQHNFAVYESTDATEAIFAGDITTGPADTTYSFQAPAEAGTYQFRCDIHPTQMTGELVVQ